MAQEGMSAKQHLGGIYRITCGDYFYFGSTRNFSSRRYVHEWSLKKGMHCNPVLQDAFNRLGKIGFSVIEAIHSDDPLTPSEQAHIDIHRGNPFLCNIIDPVPKYMTDEEWSEIRANAPGRYNRSEESKARIAESKKGSLNPRSKAVIVTHPDGTEVEFPSQTAAAQFFEVTQQSLSLWMSGKIAWPGDTAKVGKEWIWRFRARFKDA